MYDILKKAKEVVDWEFNCPGDQNKGQYGPMRVSRNAGYGPYEYDINHGYTISWHGVVVYSRTDAGVVTFRPDSCWVDHLNKMVAVKNGQYHYRQRRHGKKMGYKEPSAVHLI